MTQSQPQPETVADAIAQGEVLLRENRLDEAEELFARCRERFPDHARIMERHAHVALRRRRLDEALGRYAALTAAHPGNLAGLLGLGNVLTQLGRLDEAQAGLEAARELFPDNAWVTAALERLAGLRLDQAEPAAAPERPEQAEQAGPTGRHEKTDKYVRCAVCGKKLVSISQKHLATHGLTRKQYMDTYAVAKSELSVKTTRKR